MRLLLPLLLIAGFAFGQIPNYVPQANLVAWYGFNGNSNDESGLSNNGNVSGAILTTDRFNSSNSAYSFDGIDDYIQVNTIFDYEERTVSCWFRATDLIGNGASSRNFLTIDSDALLFGGVTFKITDSVMYIFGGGESTPFQDSVDANIWHHIVTVRDSVNINYYFNGNHVGTSLSGSIGSSNNPNPNLVIGSGRVLTAQNFEGDVDDVGIWNRALTECEINNLHTAQLNAPSPSFTAAPLSGCAPLTVTFSNTSSPANSCIWDFGDGTILNDCGAPVHLYVDTGLYDITLTIIDSIGCETTTTWQDFIFAEYCNVGLNELTNKDRELIKITNLLGQETPYKPNTPLIYIYSDGTTEKKFVLE